MKFDYSCKTDKRVIEASPYALDYPKDVEKAPDTPGVYMLIDIVDNVLRVGKATGKGLKEEIKSVKETPVEKDVKKYRWFKTSSDDVAKELEEDWLKKYQLNKNLVGK